MMRLIGRMVPSVPLALIRALKICRSLDMFLNSCQTTIAPFAPSEAILGRSWSFTAVEIARPKVGQSAEAGLATRSPSGTMIWSATRTAFARNTNRMGTPEARPSWPDDR